MMKKSGSNWFQTKIHSALHIISYLSKTHIICQNTPGTIEILQPHNTLVHE